MVSLFEESFLRSLNAAFWEIEQGNVPIFHNVSERENEALTQAKAVNTIDLPGWDDMEFGDDFWSSFDSAVHKITGRDDLLFEAGEYSLKCTQDQTDFEYFPIEPSDLDFFFSRNYGLIVVAVMVFMHQNDMIPSLGGGDSDYFVDALLDIDPEADEAEINDIVRQARKIKIAEPRFRDFCKYMETDLNLVAIGSIINRYADEFQSNPLKLLGDAVIDLQRFAEDWDNRFDDMIEESNLFESLVWYGNLEQFNNYDYDFNQNYGSGEGTYIRFSSNVKEPLITQEVLDRWAMITENPPPEDIIDRYSNILTQLYVQSNIAEFARVSSGSDLVLDIYKELLRQSGGREGGGQKWESVMLCSGFTQLLKETRRFCMWQYGREPREDSEDLTAERNVLQQVRSLRRDRAAQGAGGQNPAGAGAREEETEEGDL